MDKVAIWGSYAYDNYGDDLMALEYGLQLKRLGARPVVFALNRQLARDYELEVSESAEELIRDARFCAFGGGSLLSPGKAQTGPYAASKQREYEELLAALQRHRCPLYLFSIGGDGDENGPIDIAPYRRALLESDLCRMATVRQDADAGKLKDHFGIDAHHFPDVLLNVREFWNLPPRSAGSGRMQVGLNFPAGQRMLAMAVRVIARLHPNIDFHFIQTVAPPPRGRGGYGNEIRIDRETDNLKNHTYRDPRQTLEFLNTLDVILSHKLHLGLTALALSVPFVFIGTLHKSAAFLKSVGADFTIWRRPESLGQALRILRLVVSRQRVDELRLGFDFRLIEEFSRRSEGHLDKLREVFLAHRGTQN